jgi:ankyrin repeat protein
MGSARRPRGSRSDSALRVHATGAILLAGLFLATVPDSPVADAAMRGDVEGVRSLLHEGADVNAAQGDGMTALHWAAANGDAGLARVLLEARADLRAATRVGGYTPLLVASRAGSAQVVAVLLEAGSDPNTGTATGATPLHLAAASGDAASVSLLIDAGAGVDSRELGAGQTPLMFAADRGRLETVRILLEAGADPSITSAVVDIPAREQADRAASRHRNERLAELRTAEGEAPKVPRDPAAELRGLGEARQRDASSQPAREAANAEEVGEAAAVVEEAGASGAEADGEEGTMGDVEAAESGEDEDEAEGDDEEPRPPTYGELVGNHGGLTALLHAVRQGRTETALTLLDGGADVNQVSAGDHTSPLLMATINGHFDLAGLLLQRGADPNLASDAGATPLYATLNVEWAPKALYPQPKAHEQQRVTYLEFMETLLEAGADPDARLTKHLWYMSYNFDLLGVDTKGATPFWRAAYATDVEAMKLLLAYGADPNIPTQKVPERRRRSEGDKKQEEDDPSGLPPVPPGGPAVYPIHAASGVGYGKDFAANSHRHTPDGWLPAVRFLVETVGADVNARDHEGYNTIHHAASRGDVELILYLVEQGGDVTAVSRKGQTTADMANGPVQRVQPFPEAVELLESLGSENNHNCLSC